MIMISKDGKWMYEVNNDGAATLIEPHTKDVREGSIMVPSEVDGYPVTSLGVSCFCGCTSLKEITISDSVTSLGNWCFSDCTSLTSITIPDSVTSLRHKCFKNCTSLQSVTMLNPDIKWDKTTFEKCPNTIELRYKYW